ncbi:MAG: K(+)-transporting ATPase subunit F [Leptolyngbya sp. SIO4C1]|nr:K(+)-transporting ATPase subunit F [Leptolyngbya sp. SIO4C1]
MKRTSLIDRLPTAWVDMLETLHTQCRRQPFALAPFFALCLNLVLAPAVYAASEMLTRKAAYAIGVLLLVTVGLSIYLFAVIFQPERF